MKDFPLTSPVTPKQLGSDYFNLGLQQAPAHLKGNYCSFCENLEHLEMLSGVTQENLLTNWKNGAGRAERNGVAVDRVLLCEEKHDLCSKNSWWPLDLGQTLRILGP